MCIMADKIPYWIPNLDLVKRFKCIMTIPKPPIVVGIYISKSTILNMVSLHIFRKAYLDIPKMCTYNESKFINRSKEYFLHINK